MNKVVAMNDPIILLGIDCLIFQILVLDSGVVVEFGAPTELMNKRNGLFRSLCVAAGIITDAEEQGKGAMQKKKTE